MGKWRFTGIGCNCGRFNKVRYHWDFYGDYLLLWNIIGISLGFYELTNNFMAIIMGYLWDDIWEKARTFTKQILTNTVNILLLLVAKITNKQSVILARDSTILAKQSDCSGKQTMEVKFFSKISWFFSNKKRQA